LQPLCEHRQAGLRFLIIGVQAFEHTDALQTLGLLRPRRQRPRCRRAAQKRDEVAPPHWLIPPVLSAKDSTTWAWQETAPLRHFNAANVAVGSKSVIAVISAARPFPPMNRHSPAPIERPLRARKRHMHRSKRIAIIRSPRRRGRAAFSIVLRAAARRRTDRTS